jgi:hypothetical protein
MNNQLIAATVSVALGVAASLYCTQASACGIPDFVAAAASGAQGATLQQAAAAFAASNVAATTSAAAAQNGFDWYPHPSIVGLWKFNWTSQGNTGLGIPDGAPLDFGFQTWHDDGTELTNSGSRAPATGDFCQGVWAQRSDGSIKLNHWTLSWVPDPSTGVIVFQGPGNIHEQLKLDRSGNTMTGTVTIDQYNADQSAVLAHLTGTVAGTRVTVN